MTEPLPTSALDYPLNPACVADRPAQPRDSARLMVVHRSTGQVEHAHVRDLPQWLRAGDHLVVNTTYVMRARFIVERGSDGRRSEGLLLAPLPDGHWHALLRESKRFRSGDELILLRQKPDTQRARESSGQPVAGMKEAAPARDRLRLIARQGEGWVVRLQAHDGAPVERMMERSGWTPLPPYILRARAERHAQQDDDADRAWYQTVFAHTNAAGDPAMERSVAAPTAGLHFTPELLARLHAQGVERLEVTLSVGAGTFKPVETATLAEHPMHRERCHVPAQTLRALRALTGPRAAGQARLVAVGTTSVRTLESLPNPLPERPPPLCAVGATAHAGTSHAIAGYAAADHNTAGYAADGWSMDTRLLIQPGHSFRYVDALLTNFHLPRSTLLALVGALVGLDRLKELYALAQERGYRFFSYGDAMLIL